MSETKSFEPTKDEAGKRMPEQREPSRHEAFHKGENAPEYITGEFIRELNEQNDEIGIHLAELINQKLSSSESDQSEQLRELMLLSASVFRNNELYGQKLKHDRVFHMLTEYMKSTRNTERDMKLQRQVGLLLTEMRAVGANETEYDEDWQTVVERLFV